MENGKSKMETRNWKLEIRQSKIENRYLFNRYLFGSGPAFIVQDGIPAAYAIGRFTDGGGTGPEISARLSPYPLAAFALGPWPPGHAIAGHVRVSG